MRYRVEIYRWDEPLKSPAAFAIRVARQWSGRRFMPLSLDALNVGFFVFHTVWIAFNCLGWAWRRTRRWQLATLSLTALSWFGLGIWYGWGYCPFTDWHWQIRECLGYDDPPSYIQLLIREVSGLDLQPATANALALGTLIVVGALTAFLNVRDIRRHRDAAAPTRRPFD